MKVREALSMLQKHDPDEVICISWWTQDLFIDEYGDANDDSWTYAVAQYDHEEGYAHANETIWENLRYAMTKFNEKETKRGNK